VLWTYTRRRQAATGARQVNALEKWEEPRPVTALRGFLGFTNYYASYCPDYADLAAPLTELLKVGKHAGRKGSQAPIFLGEQERAAFKAIKERLAQGLTLQTVNPDRPFILRVDAG